jgi:SAM-dependent methyltransferase
MNDKTAQWVLDQYEQLEPGQSDSWNPLRSDIQLEYRLSLFFALTRAMRSINVDIGGLSVLDFGCGNGRSSRMYLDLGISPQQITGVDIRPAALGLAHHLHPTITYRVFEDQPNPLNEQYFDWVSMCTVISSVLREGRKPLIEMACRSLRPGGYLFYFDLWRANDFAGSDRIDVRALLRELDVIWWTPLRSQQCFPSVRPINGQHRGASPVRSLIQHARKLRRMLKPLYEVVLAQKLQDRQADAPSAPDDRPRGPSTGEPRNEK